MFCLRVCVCVCRDVCLQMVSPLRITNIIYFFICLLYSVESTAVSKFIFTEFLKAFWLILVFHARQMAVAVPRGLQLHGVVAGGRRSKGSLTMEQPGWEGLLWVPVVNLSFPHKTLQALSVHRSWNCLPALLIIHYLWLPSWLLMGPVWFGVGDSYLQSLDQDVRVLMNIMQLWCLAKVGAWETWTGPEVGLLVLIRATFNLTLLLGQCNWFSLILWPLTQFPEMAKRWR